MSSRFVLERDLLLAGLSQQAYPKIATYHSVKHLELSHLENVDSAGVAYLVQIKTQFPALLMVNASAKLQVLAELYGVENLFEK
ncbi:hypothetical protein DS885_15400 [Psychromonas sp. B3M02]|uniref:hypothetical protein n=1 Tax=unclassified Psychromonas TaxID=2614957 RepID=UPI000DEAF477|nr:hypothetical protein [Psychromonas sp. B3M02]RBW42423.1 hypothetical protein DS885_15400 [Psychromonas sp. B3M02]